MEKILNLFLLGLMLVAFPVLGQSEKNMAQKINVWSSEFGEGKSIPLDFTCDGADMSPPIEWSGIPARAESLAVIADDPDAPSGDWVHWLVYDLPPSLTQFTAGIPLGGRLSGGGGARAQRFWNVRVWRPMSSEGCASILF